MSFDKDDQLERDGFYDEGVDEVEPPCYSDYDGPQVRNYVRAALQRKRLQGRNYFVQADAAMAWQTFHYDPADKTITAVMPGQKDLDEERGALLARINGGDDMSDNMDPEFLRQQAEKLLMRAQILESVPQTDSFEIGQCLTYQKTFGTAQTYLYAAIKSSDGLWWVTGNRTPKQGMFWSQLIAEIGVSNLPTVTVMTHGTTLLDWVSRQTKALKTTEGADVVTEDGLNEERSK
jgi:hypothetical protein